MLLLPTTLTHAQARESLSMLVGALKRDDDTQIVVDASGLMHFDSSALAVLLECKRMALAWGKTSFAVKNAPKQLAQLSQLYGLGEILMIEVGPATPSAALTTA